MSAKHKLSDFEWSKSHFLDTQTRSFRYKGSYYKGVLPSAEDHMRNSHLQYFLDDCAGKNFIPKMYKTNMQVEQFVAIYRQDTEYFYVDPEYWHPESIKDAALLFLEFNLFLLERGFCLHDAHSGNFVLEKGCRPKWCDIGSIKRLTPANQASGIDQCVRYLIYPLILRGKSRHFSEWARLSFAHGLTHDLAGELRLFNHLSQIQGTRKNILESLKELVKSMCFEYPQTTWSNYFSLKNLSGSILTTARIKIFQSIIKAIAPKSAIDVAANSGFFSILTAREGAQVLALEPDEGALAQLHAYLSDGNELLKLKFTVDQVRSTYTSAAGELALALALTHHLFLSQKYSWPLIADILAGYTKNCLLTEFMPNGLSGAQQPASLPENYRLDIFRMHLERYFQSCEIIEYSVPEGTAPRIFLLCKGKKTEPAEARRPLWAF